MTIFGQCYNLLNNNPAYQLCVNYDRRPVSFCHLKSNGGFYRCDDQFVDKVFRERQVR